MIIFHLSFDVSHLSPGDHRLYETVSKNRLEWVSVSTVTRERRVRFAIIKANAQNYPTLPRYGTDWDPL
jgi:hypothetical protein